MKLKQSKMLSSEQILIHRVRGGNVVLAIDPRDKKRHVLPDRTEWICTARIRTRAVYRLVVIENETCRHAARFASRSRRSDAR